MEHERGSELAICISTWTAAAETVTVDFVDDVGFSVRVDEAGRVDGAALGEGTRERVGGGDVGACDAVGGGGADAVMVAGGIGGEIEEEEVWL